MCGHKLLQNIPKIKFLNREFENRKPQCCEQHTDIQVKIILGRNDCTNVVRRSRGKKHIFYCSHVFSARQHSRSTQTAMAISTLTVWYSAFQLNCTFSLINELIIQSNLIDTTTILVIHEQYDHDTMEKQSLHSNSHRIVRTCWEHVSEEHFVETTMFIYFLQYFQPKYFAIIFRSLWLDTEDRK